MEQTRLMLFTQCLNQFVPQVRQLQMKKYHFTRGHHVKSQHTHTQMILKFKQRRIISDSVTVKSQKALQVSGTSSFKVADVVMCLLAAIYPNIKITQYEYFFFFFHILTSK